MRLFSVDRDLGVKSFLMKLLNNSCPGVQTMFDGPRLEGRVNLTLVVMVVPLVNGKLATRHAFSAVTKEFSSRGVALVLDRPRGLDEVVLGFRWRGSVTWLSGKAKHLNPLGGGFYQLGIRMTERLCSAEHPELESLYCW